VAVNFGKKFSENNFLPQLSKCLHPQLRLACEMGGAHFRPPRKRFRKKKLKINPLL